MKIKSQKEVEGVSVEVVDRLELEKAIVTQLALAIGALSDSNFPANEGDIAAAAGTLASIILAINTGTIDVRKL